MTPVMHTFNSAQHLFIPHYWDLVTSQWLLTARGYWLIHHKSVRVCRAEAAGELERSPLLTYTNAFSAERWMIFINYFVPSGRRFNLRRGTMMTYGASDKTKLCSSLLGIQTALAAGGQIANWVSGEPGLLVYVGMPSASAWQWEAASSGREVQGEG